MQVTRGKIPSAQKVVIYGPEGIGKSTFAARFPDPLFIDTEGSTKQLDVARTPKPSSWTMLMEQVRYVKNNPGVCKTLVIDTIDWAERLCVESVCANHGKKGIEDFGYGNGYVYAAEEWGRFLNLLTDVIDAGVNLALTAHAQLRKFDQPDEMGSYDRYELKLGKKTTAQTAGLTKEWADLVLFANYKTFSVAADEKGKKHKAQGGKRVMYTTHHPCWDAKNRHGLKDELPFDYTEIANCIEGERDGCVEATTSTVIPDERVAFEPVDVPTPFDKPDAPPQKEPAIEKILEQISIDEGAAPPGIPKALADLMAENQVAEFEIQEAVARKGYYPKNTPIANYSPDFIAGVLVGAWNQVYELIKDSRVLPF